MISGNKPVNGSPTKTEREAWERRAEVSGRSLRGVLFKGLPEILNKALHKFHTEIILQELSRIQDDSSILDAGCGYGRISVEIRKSFPKFKIIGLDSSWRYVKSYIGHISGETAAVQGDIIHLPFHSESFNAVVVVTCLMYLPHHLCSKCLQELFRVAKRGGVIILVEPGLAAQKTYSCFGLTKYLRRGGRSGKYNTGGAGFRLRELMAWVKENRGNVSKVYGNPGFALMLLPLLAALWISSGPLFQKLYRLSCSLDRIFQNRGTYSIHMGLVLKKE